MSDFNNSLIQVAASTPTTLLNPADTSVVIQLDVSNTSGEDATVSVYITKSATTYYLMKDGSLPASNTLQILRGQKMVLNTTDTLTINSSKTVNVILSYLGNI